MTDLEKLETALNDLAAAQIARNRAKEALELARATLITSGTVVGKNADEREAGIRITLGSEYAALAKAEETLIWAKTHTTIFKLRYEATRQPVELLQEAP